MANDTERALGRHREQAVADEVTYNQILSPDPATRARGRARQKVTTQRLGGTALDAYAEGASADEIRGAERDGRARGRNLLVKASERRG